MSARPRLDAGSGGGRGLPDRLIPAAVRAERGFTLVELMIVITVIGLASAVAVLSLPDRRGRVTDEALKFAARVRAAHDVAVVEASPVSIWVTRGGYGFDRRADGAWTPMTAKPLRVAQWEDGTQAGIPDASGRVRVTFDVTGLADRPLELRLTRDRASSIVRIGADGSVRVDG
ncbi:GspH/FimT family pseudopilin [Sphingomonas sanguinis]|uniref:Type II secretion system protein H n=2 Tax=Sphingomonas sanguinis TaxID=33051 RepID=A0ABX1URQ2_9SPHN|nr:GspH/FimT family pseudopilin [Sphingomonas sanguinis]MBZ6381249.1 prepilin-type N-terminal cleavage/methylation domain-containing protein [Sphingomonas sanguinis]NNG50195.1 prepilin-type N-terminal cleavage/methylation domain-containing protein [Sphingomonas sanguinis]NNG55096.1 prepilin-type N-terminal cleavage/methylation domain-containing protein [Sphingomonas sanguinis]